MIHPDAFKPLSRNVRSLGNLILHQKLDLPLRKLCATNLTLVPGSIIYVVGAGGAGKTSLLRAFMQNCFGDQSGWPAGVIPYAYAAAINSDRTYFSPDALADDLLVELGDPFARRAMALPTDERAEAIERAYLKIGRAPRTVKEKFESVEDLGLRAKLRYLVVDEANLMVMVQRNHVATDYIEFLRSLATRTQCILLLAGTFEMVDVMNFSAQINRRVLNIHLERLGIKTDAEAAIFAAVAQGVAADYKVDGELVLDNLDWFYEASYGLVGELDGLFMRARVEALVHEREVPSWTDICNALQAPRLLRRMRIEADLVEAAFAEEMTQRQKKYLRAARTRSAGRRDAKRHTVIHA